MSKISIRSDFFFRGKMMFGWLQGTYKDGFLSALDLIYKEINYNANKINVLGYTENYSMSDIYDVINAYGNILLSDKNIIEYDGYKGDAYNGDLVDTVSYYSGISKELTGKVLKQLFWSTEQGRIDSTIWIKPRSYMNTSGYRELREDAVGSNWFKNLMYILAFVGISIAGFYVYRTYATYKMAKNTIPYRRRLTS